MRRYKIIAKSSLYPITLAGDMEKLINESAAEGARLESLTTVCRSTNDHEMVMVAVLYFELAEYRSPT